jgi:hypothetical protein
LIFETATEVKQGGGDMSLAGPKLPKAEPVTAMTEKAGTTE